MFRAIPTFCVLALAILVVARSQGEIVYKRDGGKVAGTIVKDKTNFEYVTIKSRYGTFKIPRSDIKEIDYAAETTESYDDVVKNYKDTAEDQFELALWCLEHRYRKEYEQHLAKVLELDPDHAQARSRLGYRQFGGKWVSEQEFYESQGYVQYKGKWVLPQEKDRAERKQEDTTARREYYRKIRLYQRWLRQDKQERQDDGRRGLLAITDPVAVEPLFEILAKTGEDEERRLLIDILDQIPGEESTAGLVTLALLERVEGNHRAAAAALVERKSPKLVRDVATALKDNENDTVLNAANVLGEIGDESVVTALIDALETTHRSVYEPSFVERGGALGGGIQIKPRTTIITGNGIMVRQPNYSPYQIAQNGVGLSPIPEKIVTVETKRNPEVLKALNKITGADHGYDKDRWTSWVRQNYRSKAAKIVK